MKALATMANLRDTENFCELDSPRFEADHAGNPPRFTGELRVVSWNIKFSRKIDAAIEELRKIPALAGADILLLQEMDEHGVESIASELAYNYIYYPASVHCRTDRKFGNAVLSKWHIAAGRKLQLPHESPRTGEVRIATRAHLDIGGRDLLAYSVHTETFALSSAKRNEQFEALAEDIAGQPHEHVIVGGDFNTIRGKDIEILEKLFAGAGLKRVSTGAEPTIRAAMIGFSFDHIFTRGMANIEKDVWKGTRASDHYPVWQRLSLA